MQVTSKVDSLPTVNQSQFPNLPEVPHGYALHFKSTPWNRLERELMAAAIIQTCVRLSQWQPITTADLQETMSRYYGFNELTGYYWAGFHELLTLGDIDAVDYVGEFYIVPLPSLATKAFAKPEGVELVPAYTIGQPPAAPKVRIIRHG